MRHKAVLPHDGARLSLRVTSAAALAEHIHFPFQGEYMVVRAFRLVAAMSIALGMSACGGGGSDYHPSTPATTTTANASAAAGPDQTPPSAGSSAASNGMATSSNSSSAMQDAPVNTVPVVVRASPRANDYNRPFISVTLCIPSTTTCQVIDNVLVDTGSTGFRVLGNILNPALKLPQVADSTGMSAGECMLFGISSVPGKAQQASWGAVRKADLKIAGMTAQSLSIEVINDASLPGIPNGCSNAADRQTVDFGFNGILGVRGLDADCGAVCVNAVPAVPRYYRCVTDGCTAASLPLDAQVRNPVALFGPGYDNGTAIVLPPLDGVSNVPLQGTLTFGIGTRTNNQLGNAKIFRTDSAGYVATTYGGARAQAMLDTGTPQILFHDDDIQRCTSSFTTSVYCPASATQITAIIESADGVRDTVGVSIVPLPSNMPFQAASFGRYVDAGSRIVWGLPFYFGRTVFTAISGKDTPAGPGPYIAY